MQDTSIDTRKKYVKMKQDVYEQLARTFLDKKNKKSHKKRILWILLSIVLFAVIYSIRIPVDKKETFLKSLYVIKDKTPILIEYDFTLPGNAKVQTLSFNLNNIDLSAYYFLDLSIRTEAKTKLDTVIKVEIENSLLEKDAQYLSGINVNWEKFSLPLSNFKMIKEWSSIKALTFTVEDWNVSNKKDKLYIDNICFVEKDKYQINP